MALEAITSPYLANFVPNELHSSSSFPFEVNAGNKQMHEIGFFNGNGPSLPPLPCFPPTNWISHSSSPPSPSSSSCLSSSAVGHLLSPMEAKQPGRSSSAENETQKKRRRPRSLKNSQELEKQRMTHITVERNRRKQMNEHLAVLRSLMPESYIQRGDQASIVGGAIDFVKELEQLVQSLEVQKSETNKRRGTGESLPFASFFTCPQYSFTGNRLSGEPPSEDSPALADIQVAMSETYASLTVLTLRRPGQLLRMVAGLQGLRLTVLHLNVTTTEPFVLYSFSTKVEEDCKLNTADEIASAFHQMLVTREAALMGGFTAKSEEHL
ncbi:transcription factor bHLH94-like [Nymphaea colorata]|nr:transcription factor bHLH94-like [Nymphaea colorata]